MSYYGTKEYWFRRYEEDSDPYEWYLDYRQIRDNIINHINTTNNILVVGCGTSGIPFDLLKDGFKDIVSMDICENVIHEMKERYKDYPELKFMTMDICNMNFKDQTFDCIIDKGTLDALICSDNFIDEIPKATKEIYRVLKSGAIYILVSVGDPSMRLPIFEEGDNNWIILPHNKLSIVKENAKKDYYVYFFKKP